MIGPLVLFRGADGGGVQRRGCGLHARTDGRRGILHRYCIPDLIEGGRWMDGWMDGGREMDGCHAVIHSFIHSFLILGSAASSDSYLRIDRIIEVAMHSGAQVRCSISPSIHTSVHLSIHLSINSSHNIHLPIHPSIYSSIYPSIHLYTTIYSSIHPTIHL